VGDVHHVLVVEGRLDLPVHLEDVVTGAGGQFGGDAGGELVDRDVVNPSVHPVGLAPLRDKLVEGGVVRRHEVAPGQDPERGPLDLRRGDTGLPGRQPRQGRAGPPGARSDQQLPAAEPLAQARSRDAIHHPSLPPATLRGGAPSQTSDPRFPLSAYVSTRRCVLPPSGRLPPPPIPWTSATPLHTSCRSIGGHSGRDGSSLSPSRHRQSIRPRSDRRRRSTGAPPEAIPAATPPSVRPRRSRRRGSARW